MNAARTYSKPAFVLWASVVVIADLVSTYALIQTLLRGLFLAAALLAIDAIVATWVLLVVYGIWRDGRAERA